MKMTSKKLLALAIAACLNLALTNVRAEPNDTSSTSTDRNTTRTTTSEKKTSYDNTASTESTPAKCNRASGLIGMSIRNQNDEHLGKVKDIVFDLKSDRVAYVVMSASGTGVLGFKEKQLAVPLNAFTTSSDEKHLVLRADKSKIDAAAGITDNNWPSASNPSWGAEPFWQTDQDKTDKTDTNVKSESKSYEQTPPAPK